MVFVVQIAWGTRVESPDRILPLAATGHDKTTFRARKLPRVHFTGENSGCPSQTIRDYRREPRMDWRAIPWARRDSSVELYAYAKVLDVVKARGYHDSFCICMHLAAFFGSCKEYRTTIVDYLVFLRTRGPSEITIPQEKIFRQEKQTLSKNRTFLPNSNVIWKLIKISRLSNS